MEFLMIFVKAIVITFFIYGVISFILNVREEHARRKTNMKQPASKEQVDLNPAEFPTNAYTETKDTVIPPSYKPRSIKDMELS